MGAIFLVVQLILALMLIGIVLIQRTNSSGLGLGDDQSGGMGGMMTGRSQANMLTRATALIAAAFIAVCLISAILASRGSDGRSTADIAREAERLGSTQQGDAPAVPSTSTSTQQGNNDLLNSLGGSSTPSSSPASTPAVPSE